MARKKAQGKGPVVGERPFLHIQLRAFAHATEEPERVRRAVATAAGFDLDTADDAKRFDRATTVLRSEGHFHNPITIFETELTRVGEIRRFWRALFKDTAAKARLHAEVDERLDDDLVFWMRLDKQAAYQGTLRLTQGEDIIQVRAKLATYPKDRAVGLDFLRTFLDGADGDDDRQDVPAS